MPPELRAQLDEMAKASGRSLNVEIVMRLQHSLSKEMGEMVMLAQAAKVVGIRARSRASAERLPEGTLLTNDKYIDQLAEIVARKVGERLRDLPQPGDED